MKTNTITLIFISFLIFSNSFGQETSIFIPKEVKTAFKNQTRSRTGAPGANYWQNAVDYKIEVNFVPESGKLSGKETVTYTNNSQGSLNTLVFNLYPNLFKKGSKRDREIDSRDIHDGLEVKKITIDGAVVDPKTKRASYEGTRMNLALSKPLTQKSKVTMVLEWEFTMQNYTTIRVGKYDPNTWFIGYWYPQVAVYDDIFGWDVIDYDGLHEFYSPYANFDVKVTVPASQIVWASGIWQNPDQILSDTYLSRYKEALTSKDVIRIVEEEDLPKKITKAEKENTWNFVAENVTDFCFATSDHYLWDGVSLITDKKTNKTTFIQSAYNKSSRDFADVADIAKKTINYLSTVMPAIPFPYPRMTVFNGADGMEFPMMVNDGSEYGKSETVNLTSHEISHTYFPFYLGINQERYSWMDEGWAMFLPAEFQGELVPNNNQKAFSATNYIFSAGNSLEMPMMVPSFFIKSYEYYIASYYRPEIAYRTLQNLLGKDLFLKALQEYMRRWNGKYPGPYDFFFTFNDVAKQDLSWFWKPWFFEMAYPDLGIVSITKNEKEYIFEIENVGGLPLPIELTVEFNDGTKTTVSKTADAWKSGNKTYQLKYTTEKTISRCTLGADWIPDTNYSNNQK